MKSKFFIYSFDANKGSGDREYRVCTPQEWCDKMPNGLLHHEGTLFHKSADKALKQWLKKNNPSDWVFFEG